MVGEGVEVVVGVSCDPQLGPVLLFGSGDVMVEVYNDVALRRCPITRAEARAMIAEVKGARLLRGFRGRPPADLEPLEDTPVRVSHFAMHFEGHLQSWTSIRRRQSRSGCTSWAKNSMASSASAEALCWVGSRTKY